MYAKGNQVPSYGAPSSGNRPPSPSGSYNLVK